MAHSEPTNVFLKLSPETAMLSAPFRCTNPPPPVPPFLLKQNLFPTSQDESFIPDISDYIRGSVNPYLREVMDTGLHSIRSWVRSYLRFRYTLTVGIPTVEVEW